MGDLLTPKEAAQLTGLSTKTLANHRRLGAWPLRFTKLGTLRAGARKDTRPVRYLRSDIQHFIESNKLSSRTEAI